MPVQACTVCAAPLSSNTQAIAQETIFRTISFLGTCVFLFFLKFSEREMSNRAFEDMFAPNGGRIRSLYVPAIAYPDEPEICATNSTKCSFAPRILFHFGASLAHLWRILRRSDAIPSHPTSDPPPTPPA